MRLFLFVILPFLITSCYSSVNPPLVERHEFRVEVSTGGKKIEDFNKKLVHRIYLSRKSLDELFGANGDSLDLGINSERAVDEKGLKYGIIIKYQKGGKEKASKLEILNGDIVTAINVGVPTDKKDFLNLRTSLLKSGYSSLTLKRKGVSHKNLYYLTD